MSRTISRGLQALMATGVSALVLASTMVKPLEGEKLKPYYDVAGVLTVCHGHTGSDIDPDKTYTNAECQALLDSDLSKVKQQVDQLVDINVPSGTKAGLYSFTYNVGVNAFARSTLLKKLNQNDIHGACGELKRWVFAGGKQWKGLKTRREVEESLCRYQLESER